MQISLFNNNMHYTKYLIINKTLKMINLIIIQFNLKLIIIISNYSVIIKTVSDLTFKLFGIDKLLDISMNQRSRYIKFDFNRILSNFRK